MDFKQQVYDVIASFSGQNNVIVINTAYVDMLGDLESALFLSQVIYWTDKSTRKDGFFYKTDDEWSQELRISKYAIRKARKKLEDLGILETKVKKANGNPTVHYRLNKERFIEMAISFLRNRKNDHIEIEKTLTEITTEITTKIDDDKPNPFKEYEQAFGHLPPSILQHEFSQIISSGQFQEPEAILCEVIKRARERMPRNPAKYISSILKNLEYMGLFTLEAVREYNELHDRKTKRVGRVKKSADEVNWEEL
ncbi:DnaD domain protein [Geobacillus sp. FJAT-46040]|uniref:DnaD domain protein n=1 Tax=Geobacillus sp. FJAT-46040 TaxID=2011017 RepID=UPI000BB98752|nr:DnaD domain protein [Geobacillus sp. FJAT-46040]